MSPHWRGHPDAVLVTPAHQFPTGVVLSPDRRAAVLDWAERSDAINLEDDYDAEFRYDRAPVGRPQGAGASGRPSPISAPRARRWHRPFAWGGWSRPRPSCARSRTRFCTR